MFLNINKPQDFTYFQTLDNFEIEKLKKADRKYNPVSFFYFTLKNIYLPELNCKRACALSSRSISVSNSSSVAFPSVQFFFRRFAFRSCRFDIYLAGSFGDVG